jgi:hypothetical protein
VEDAATDREGVASSDNARWVQTDDDTIGTPPIAEPAIPCDNRSMKMQ